MSPSQSWHTGISADINLDYILFTPISSKTLRCHTLNWIVRLEREALEPLITATKKRQGWSNSEKTTCIILSNISKSRASLHQIVLQAVIPWIHRTEDVNSFHCLLISLALSFAVWFHPSPIAGSRILHLTLIEFEGRTVKYLSCLFFLLQFMARVQGTRNKNWSEKNKMG